MSYFYRTPIYNFANVNLRKQKKSTFFEKKLPKNLQVQKKVVPLHRFRKLKGV